MATASFAANNVFSVEQNFKCSLSGNKKTSSLNKVEEVIGCSVSTTSTVVTNRVKSTTRTTATTLQCDTPEELANLHKLMKAVGMGI